MFKDTNKEHLTRENMDVAEKREILTEKRILF